MKMLKEILIAMMCFMLISPAYLMAEPVNGQVVAGQADINQAGPLTTIDQTSHRAVVNWKSFDINANEAVRHNMPSRDSAALHRVTGGGAASQLAGELSSNGNIYLVNPAGVVIHNGARIDTGGFVATTRDISNENFMDGNMVFDKPGQVGAQIVNKGQINVRESGLAALVAPSVRNEGIIAARLGKVALASGDSTYKLDMYGDDLINFTLDETKVDQLHTTDGTPLGVENTGLVKAEGGVVLLSATQLDGVVSSVVNSGMISADSAEAKGGRVIFKGQGENVGVVNIGTITASSENGDGGSIRLVSDGTVTASGVIEAKGAEKGGQIDISGAKETNISEAKITTEGDEGGLIRLGGEFQGGKEKFSVSDETKDSFVSRFEPQKALAETQTLTVDWASEISAGSDGTLIAWSAGKTLLDGFLSARYLETSGSSLTIRTNPILSSNSTWIIDPTDIRVSNSVTHSIEDGNINPSLLIAYLDTFNVNNVTFNASNSITFEDDFTIEFTKHGFGSTFWQAPTINIFNGITINKPNASMFLYGEIINIGNNVTINGGIQLNSDVINIGDYLTITDGSISIRTKNLHFPATTNINGDVTIYDYDNMMIGLETLVIDSGAKIYSQNQISIYGDNVQIGNGIDINNPTIRAKNIRLVGYKLQDQSLPSFKLGIYALEAENIEFWETYIGSGTPGINIIPLNNDIGPHVTNLHTVKLWSDFISYWPFSSTIALDQNGISWEYALPQQPNISQVTISNASTSGLSAFNFDSTGQIKYTGITNDEITINITDLLAAINSNSATGFQIISDGDLILSSDILISKSVGLGFTASGDITFDGAIGLSSGNLVAYSSAGDITINGGIVLDNGVAAIIAAGSIDLNNNISYTNSAPNDFTIIAEEVNILQGVQLTGNSTMTISSDNFHLGDNAKIEILPYTPEAKLEISGSSVLAPTSFIAGQGAILRSGEVNISMDNITANGSSINGAYWARLHGDNLTLNGVNITGGVVTLTGNKSLAINSNSYVKGNDGATVGSSGSLTIGGGAQVESETKVTLLAGGQGNISGGSVAKPVIKAPTVEFNDHGTFNLGTHSVQTANLAYGVTTQLQGNGADRPHIFGLSQSWFDSFGNFTPETWKNNIAWKFYSVILQAANSFDLWISSRPTSDSPNANSNSSSSGVDTERADNGSDPFLFTKRNDESELLVASGMTQESGGGTTVSNPIIAPIVPTELEKSIDNSLKRVLDSVIQELGFGSLDSPEYSSWLNSTFFNNVESMLASALVSFSSDAVLPDGALDTIIQKVGSAFKGKDAAFSLGKDLIVAIITEICSQIMHSAAGIPDEPSTNSQIWGDYLIQVACGVIKATLSSTNPAELQFNLVKEQVLVTINQAKTAFDKSKQYTETIKAAQESSLNLVGSWARASITQETAELAGLSHAGDMAAVTERIQEQFTDPYFLESLGFPGFGALKNTFFPADDQYREACADLVNDMAKLIAAQAKGKSISSRDIAIIVSKTKKFGVNLSGGLLAMNAVLTIAKEFLGEGTAFLIEEQLRPPDNPNNNPSVGTGSELQEERRNPLNNYQPTPWYMK